MEKVTIADLKNRLSAYLRKVRAGESVLVLDRNRPIARIEPVRGKEEREGRLARLEAAGLVRLPTQPIPIELLKVEAPVSKESVLNALLEERSEGR